MAVGTLTLLDPPGAVAGLWSHLRLSLFTGKQEVVDTCHSCCYISFGLSVLFPHDYKTRATLVGVVPIPLCLLQDEGGALVRADC